MEFLRIQIPTDRQQRDSDVDLQICRNMFDTLNNCATAAYNYGNNQESPGYFEWLFRVVILSGYFEWLFRVAITSGYFEWLLRVVISSGYFEWLFRVVISSGYFEWLFRVVISSSYFEWLFHKI